MITKKYKKLRAHMLECDVDQAWIAKKLDRSLTYVSERFRGEHPWSMKDVCVLCRLLRINTNEITTYFPEDGGEAIRSIREIA